MGEPLVRWVGGKTQLLPEILQRVPSDVATYHEPFVGGAAVLLALSPARAHAADTNAELINFYQMSQEHPAAVCDAAERLHWDEQSYYEVRAWDRAADFLQAVSPVERAARFLFLQKTSFQGLWRVNSKRGYHNTPYGHPKRYVIDRAQVERFSLEASNVSFACEDFEACLDRAEAGDFAYLDPPYVPISPTASFTAYTVNRFTVADQVRLRDCCCRLDDRGVRFLLSNSDCADARGLYADRFNVSTVPVRRNVAARAASRGLATEVLVSNYDAGIQSHASL